MKWLVTGGFGFVGSNLAAELMARGDQVFVIDDLSSQNARANHATLVSDYPQMGSLVGSLVDLLRLEATVRDFQPDFVAHLAAQTKMSTSLVDPLLDCAANVVGTVNLLESLRKHAPQAHVFYSSTNKVYGDLDEIEYTEQALRYSPTSHALEFDETVPLTFSSPYGCSKGAADQYVLDYHRVYGMKTTVFRHSSMFGVNQHPTIDHGWVTWFCQQGLGFRADPNYASISINGNGKQVRDILHVKDVCRLYIQASEHGSQCDGRFYNIGGGLSRSLSLLELFERLNEMLGTQIKYHCLPVRISDQRYFVCDTSKVQRDFGWAPTVSIHEGLTSSIHWLTDRG